ncbi:MAG: 50S ribosomal protein L1 [Deltaproteobacteria bacterium CG07_land_8_20_14_0_80_38_7]|nr:MAG: 50S ribosomal protein L1 [Deltaproteobacteria bacterium CG07_land_8_20_14_0_80_38_7]
MAGKKYQKSREKVDTEKKYDLDEALKLLETFEKAKFDEMVDISVRLGIDTKQGDQTVRSSCSLPHGIGKKVRVAVFAKPDKQREAEEAGADIVGADDLLDKIQGGWMEFDSVIATPDMMGVVGKLGKVLGPRGLMPNPKLGTVTFEVANAVKETKAGKVEFRAEKGGIVHVPVGKRSFGVNKLKENIEKLLGAINKVKPPASKGTYIKTMFLSGTMTPGISIDVSKYQ